MKEYVVFITEPYGDFRNWNIIKKYTEFFDNAFDAYKYWCKLCNKVAKVDFYADIENFQADMGTYKGSICAGGDKYMVYIEKTENCEAPIH